MIIYKVIYNSAILCIIFTTNTVFVTQTGGLGADGHALSTPLLSSPSLHHTTLMQGDVTISYFDGMKNHPNNPTFECEV